MDGATRPKLSYVYLGVGQLGTGLTVIMVYFITFARGRHYDAECTFARHFHAFLVYHFFTQKQRTSKRISSEKKQKSKDRTGENSGYRVNNSYA